MVVVAGVWSPMRWYRDRRSRSHSQRRRSVERLPTTSTPPAPVAWTESARSTQHAAHGQQSSSLVWLHRSSWEVAPDDCQPESEGGNLETESSKLRAGFLGPGTRRSPRNLDGDAPHFPEQGGSVSAPWASVAECMPWADGASRCSITAINCGHLGSNIARFATFPPTWPVFPHKSTTVVHRRCGEVPLLLFRVHPLDSRSTVRNDDSTVA